ncbi:Bug family tripartite tricarboxylate transporter substrate binding protein [Falsiroseomonas tokyonensis]|uniref:Bug family tripartite tricarboxylate transporter substrate binding protein n=1 Tax=Falsiroseomonas tokyonensis TaxID=430521 RepID=A0ABV7BNX1_9PROT|nr:tripartite tricarboxylate transporter substrate binding protein [Falsiroseomonas tokyonensis]MBU8537294.1 tripartite tricarboxylate transporter substrate binding protein [Falsiroseomonas tokyonensis]
MKSLSRRTLLGATGGLALAAPALAQTRPVVLVVPYAPGGGTDLTAREFAHSLSEALGGQTVVVENRGGAAGHIGSVSVARARPDGLTLLFAVSTNLVVNPHMQRGDGVDLITGLAPVAQVTSYQYVLVIDPRLPINTLQELIAYARSKPKGELTYSSGGVGNANHLAGVLFSDAVGVEMEHIPYRGTGPALLDVVGGRITMNFSSPPPAIQLAREGRLRAIAVTGDGRIATLPEVPTLAQAGLPGVSITGWHGIFAPAGIPADQMERLETAARQAAANPRFANRLEQDGLEPAPVRPRGVWFEAVKAEHAFWGRKIRELNIKLD